ncbi:hypothetical protein TCAL_02610 [Tigriopus californicus]|uniref:Large ribosomal subunit protein mL54 n=1 Tax=Tigriopus californicus TaxID=6832 RepID=A0A553NFS2_TIGCA|nr:large ribosomal subunit protein mL54-like [Tigriopus californicus]TRY64303.1 hypothetical protein TCAL_02610 [Tigriopus californicus]|eukprot:TCALIF_02610-PA protein Name:"Similar to mrpl54 39S ribosomal protein L54, mitochondrial (Danio rerio)" AED:0.00 eAED:0.00 QI:65/1/1/1/1/1/2/68/131
MHGFVMGKVGICSPLRGLVSPFTVIRGMAIKKGGGGKGAAMEKIKVFPVEKDTKKLVSHCCGLNYKIDGEEVPLKPREEYPDWLWTMNMDRPLPSSEDLTPNTIEYYERLREEHKELLARRRSKEYMKPPK